MSFQLDDLVKIINPNHYAFGFEGKIIGVECKFGESAKYTIGKLNGVRYQIVDALEYELDKASFVITKTATADIGKFKIKHTGNGVAFFPRDTQDDAADSLRYCIENKKGEKDNMELLDIYESRKKRNIRGEYSEERTKIINEDIFKNLTLNFEKQIVDLYKNEYDKEISFAVILKDEMITKETKEKLDKIEKEEKEETFKLMETLEEVRAQLELAKDYETQMKILKRYDIIGKDGKINA